MTELLPLPLNFWKKRIFSVQIDLDFAHEKKQLLPIAHDIYANFDQYPTLEVTANFLDISKAFNKVWHEGLLFKLGHIEMSGKSSKSA